MRGPARFALLVALLQVLAGCAGSVEPDLLEAPEPGPGSAAATVDEVEVAPPDDPVVDVAPGGEGGAPATIPASLDPLASRSREPEAVELAPPPAGVAAVGRMDEEAQTWRAALEGVGDVIGGGIVDLPGETPVETRVNQTFESAPTEFLVETRHAGTTRWFVVVPGGPRVLDVTGASAAGDVLLTVTPDAEPGAIRLSVQPATTSRVADVALRLHALLGDPVVSGACAGPRASVNVGLDTNGQPLPESWTATVRFLTLHAIVEGVRGEAAGHDIRVNVTPQGAQGALALVGGALTGAGRDAQVLRAPAPGAAASAEQRCVPDAATSVQTLDAKLNFTVGTFVPDKEVSLNLTSFRSSGTSVVSVGWDFEVRYAVSGFVVTDNRSAREGGRLEFETPSSSYTGWVRVATRDEDGRTALRSWLDDSMHLHVRQLPWTVRDSPTSVVEIRAWYVPRIVELEIVEGTSLRFAGSDHNGRPDGFVEIVVFRSSDPTKRAPALAHETGAPRSPYTDTLRIDRERDEIEARAFLIESLAWSTGRLLGCGIRVETGVSLGPSPPVYCRPSADPFHRLEAHLRNSGDSLEFEYRSEALDVDLVVEDLPWEVHLTSNFGTTWRYVADSKISRILARVETPIYGEGVFLPGGPRPVAGSSTVEVEIREFSHAITLQTDLQSSVSYVADRPIGSVRVTTGETRIVSTLVPVEPDIDGNLPPARPGLPAFEVSARGLPSTLRAKADLASGRYEHDADGRFAGINLNVTRPEGIGETWPGREPYTRALVELRDVPPRLVAKWPAAGEQPHVAFEATDASGAAAVGDVRLRLTSRLDDPPPSLEHQLLIVDYAHERTLAARTIGTSSLRFDLVDGKTDPTLGPEGLRFRTERQGKAGGTVAVALRMLGGGSNLTLDFEGRLEEGGLVADAEIRTDFVRVQFQGHLANATFLGCVANVSWGSDGYCDKLALTIQVPELGPGTTTFLREGDEIQIHTPRPTSATAILRHAQGLGNQSFRPKLVEVRLVDTPPSARIELGENVFVGSETGLLTGSFYVSEAVDEPPSSTYRNFALVREGERGLSAIHGRVNGLRSFSMCNEDPGENDCGGEGGKITAFVVDPAGDAANFELRWHNTTYQFGSDLKMRFAIERELPQHVTVTHRTGDPDPSATSMIRYQADRPIGRTATDASANFALRTSLAADYAYYFEREGIESRATRVFSGWGIVDAGIVKVPRSLTIEWSTREGPVNYYAFRTDQRLRDCPAGYFLNTLTISASGGPLEADRLNVIGMPGFRKLEPSDFSPTMERRSWQLLSSDHLELVPRATLQPAAATLFSCAQRPPDTGISLGWWVRGGNATARISTYEFRDFHNSPFNAEDPHWFSRKETVLLCDFNGAVSFWGLGVNGQNDRNGGDPEGHWEVSVTLFHQNGRHHLCDKYGFWTTSLPAEWRASFPAQLYHWNPPAAG